MIINYKTDRLPLNFIYLGRLLFIVAIWRIIVLDWIGIILLLISLFCLFLKFGLLIDTDGKKLKKYIGFFVFKKGKWEDISLVKHLLINSAKVTQSMNVLSINRIESKIVYILIMVLPTKRIELMIGEKDFIIKASEKISLELQTTVLN
jgi:hypothetical protein